MPKDIGTAVLIYNKDMFDKEGLAYPNDSWTLKEYLDAGLLNPYIPMDRVFSILSSNLDPNNVRKNGGRVDAPLEKAVREINAIIEENAADD